MPLSNSPKARFDQKEHFDPDAAVASLARELKGQTDTYDPGAKDSFASDQDWLVEGIGRLRAGILQTRVLPQSVVTFVETLDLQAANQQIVSAAQALVETVREMREHGHRRCVFVGFDNLVHQTDE